MIKKKPYFLKDGIALYKGDSFKLLKDIDEKSIDFIFADPPYFLSSNGISCKNGKMVSVNKGKWDFSKTIEDKISYHRDWISLCKNCLNDNGSIMISSTLHSVYAIGVALEMEGFSIINNIIWQKTNPAPNLGCRCFTHSTETIIWARKVLGKSKKGKHFFDYKKMKKYNCGKQMKDVWMFEEDPIISLPTVGKKEKTEGYHPTQKPLDLLKRIVEACTKEGDLILDPFNGSGTTGLAAFILNRNYIGIDTDENYLKITKNRIKKMGRK